MILIAASRLLSSKNYTAAESTHKLLLFLDQAQGMADHIWQKVPLIASEVTRPLEKGTASLSSIETVGKVLASEGVTSPLCCGLVGRGGLAAGVEYNMITWSQVTAHLQANVQ